MKKIISFIMLCLCVVGVAALTYSALPEIKKYFTTLTL